MDLRFLDHFLLDGAVCDYTGAETMASHEALPLPRGARRRGDRSSFTDFSIHRLTGHYAGALDEWPLEGHMVLVTKGMTFVS